MSSKSEIITSIILSIIGLFIIVVPSALAYNNYISDKTLSPIAEVDTRNFFYAPSSVNFTLAKFGSDCPPEIAIYVHGFKRDDIEAKEEFNRLQTSLLHNNYRIPVVGFSWDSKVLWEQAKVNATKSGEQLANFTTEFKKWENCPKTNIRILAHSLGAAVINSTLVSLNQNANGTDMITSVHLLGAAINNTLIANNTLLGNATENVVDKFYNLYDPEDDGLTVNQLENRHPLGLVGALKLNVPSNYNEANIVYEIPPLSDADGDGNIEECFEDINPVKVWGDNHCGYIGFRNSTSGSFLDDGAINVVVEDWRNS